VGLRALIISTQFRSGFIEIKFRKSRQPAKVGVVDFPYRLRLRTTENGAGKGAAASRAAFLITQILV
jgi:hypothetical protein